MAFVKPVINEIKPDIKNLSIYLRSTKKFGKSTLFRDVVLAKYGDPSRGLLVGCGNEVGYKMLDNLNVTQVNTYKDMIELQKWLIEEKGREHHIEMIALTLGTSLPSSQTLKRSVRAILKTQVKNVNQLRLHLEVILQEKNIQQMI